MNKVFRQMMKENQCKIVETEVFKEIKDSTGNVFKVSKIVKSKQFASEEAKQLH